MDDQRKAIIINEIQNWKENRMLPEQYCDYLLALYSEGSQSDFVTTEKSTRKRNGWKPNYYFLLLIPITVFFIYFTELSITLQITIVGIFVLAGIFYTFYFFRKGILLQIPLIVSALLLLLSTVDVVSHMLPQSMEALYTTLVLNCGLWLLTGWKLRIHSFTISGVLGAILLVISIFI